jgi:UDP-glucose 4-epimerase
MSELSSMRCVVFGGGGFIGTNLCRALAGKVETLRAFGRRKSFPEALEGIDWIPGDFKDSSALASAVAGCDVVFHLITSTTPTSANVDKIADLNSNVVSFLHLLEACRLQRVRRVVFVSSGGTVYGIPNRIPTTEDSPTNPITAYGISKLAIEKYLALYEHLYGLEYRVLRVSNPYGPFQTSIRNQGVIAAFLGRALAGKPIEMWGDGSIIRDYIYIDDVVEALQKAAVHEGQARVLNIGSGEGYTLRQLVTAIEKELGLTVKILQYEGRPVDVPCSILDISSATAELGWYPRTSLTDGLEKTAGWMRKTIRR